METSAVKTGTIATVTLRSEPGSFEEHATGTVQILPARVRAPAGVSPTGDGGAAATLFVISLLGLIEDCCPYYPIYSNGFSASRIINDSYAEVILTLPGLSIFLTAHLTVKDSCPLMACDLCHSIKNYLRSTYPYCSRVHLVSCQQNSDNP